MIKLIKRHRVVMDQKTQNPTICCFQETYLSCKDKHKLKVKGWKIIFQANGTQRKVGVAILMDKSVGQNRFQGKTT